MSEDSTSYAGVDPLLSGIKGRCPRCGHGNLFQGYLKLAPQCNVCELDYSFADSGDGPVVFVLLADGFLVTALALWSEVSLGIPLWLHFILWVPLAIIIGLVLTRMLKGVLINLQYKNKAASGRLDDGHS